MLNRKAESDPGKLRLRLVLEKPAAVPDGAGGSTGGWTATGIVAADIRPVRAEERGTGEGMADLVLQKIVIRHRTDVRPGDRFRLGGRAFLILAVSDPDEDRRYLACLAEEGAA